MEPLVLIRHHERPREVARQGTLADRDGGVDGCEARADAVAEGKDGGKGGPISIVGGYLGVVLQNETEA